MVHPPLLGGVQGGHHARARRRRSAGDPGRVAGRWERKSPWSIRAKGWYSVVLLLGSEFCQGADVSAFSVVDLRMCRVEF